MISLSSEMPRLDVASVKNVMENSSGLTAVIGGNVEISRKIVETADLMGIQVPDDLSIVSMQVGRLRPGLETDAFTGIRYDWHKIITTCFEVLLGNQNYRQFSKLVFDPEVRDFPELEFSSVKDLRG